MSPRREDQRPSVLVTVFCAWSRKLADQASTIQPMRRRTAIDLFAGAGAGSLGLRQSGFEVVAAVEIDRDAAATYSLNHPTSRMFETDISTLSPRALMSEVKLAPGDLTLLKACPPCQGFSTLGKSDPDDPRNDLIDDVWRMVRATKPRAFILENVPGLLTDVRMQTFLRRTRGAGYSARTYVVDAVQLGVPQHRRRLIALGLLNGGKIRFPDNLPDAARPHFRKHITVGQALRSGSSRPDPLARSRRLRPMTLKRVMTIPIGGNRFDLPTRYQLECHQNLTSTAATGPYGRVHLDEPAPTMTTRCTTPSCGPFIHPSKPRGLSLREAATLQTFPRWYKFRGGYDSIERQIGNALPVRLARAIGYIVVDLLGERS
jgi:DNA (cytosine-5)-methyltransferase 1